MSHQSGSSRLTVTFGGPHITFTANALCPDLLDYGQIGEADNLRGRVVRAFFWLMRAWPA